MYEVQMRNQHCFDTIVKNLTKLASMEKTEILRHRSKIQFTPKAAVLQYFARTYLSTRPPSLWVQIISDVASHVRYNNGMKNEEIYLVKKNILHVKRKKTIESKKIFSWMTWVLSNICFYLQHIIPWLTKKIKKCFQKYCRLILRYHVCWCYWIERDEY